MTKYRVVMTAKNVESCPLYKPDDRTIINLPEVDMDASGRVCAFMLAELLKNRLKKPKNMLCELGEEVSHKSDYSSEFILKESVIRCPYVASEVTFDLKIEPRLEGLSLAEYQEFRGREDKRKLIEQLRKIPILSAVSADNLFDILPEMKLKKFEAEDVIIEKGQTGRYFYIIYKGEVEVIQISSDGTSSTIGRLKSGECFGEMSLLTGESVSATIKTSVGSTLLLINREGFGKLMDHNSQMRLMIMKLLAQRIKTTNQRMGQVIASGMVGQLQTFGFGELVQTLAGTESNGILHINTKDTQGQVYFMQGQVIDATIGENRGEEAFFEMMAYREGTFRFEEKQVAVKRTIIHDSMGLLLEGMRRIDEETRKWEASDFSV